MIFKLGILVFERFKTHCLYLNRLRLAVHYILSCALSKKSEKSEINIFARFFYTHSNFMGFL